MPRPGRGSRDKGSTGDRPPRCRQAYRRVACRTTIEVRPTAESSVESVERESSGGAQQERRLHRQWETIANLGCLRGPPGRRGNSPCPPRRDWASATCDGYNGTRRPPIDRRVEQPTQECRGGRGCEQPPARDSPRPLQLPRRRVFFETEREESMRTTSAATRLPQRSFFCASLSG